MVGANMCSAYSGSKAAVHAMHESIYQELRDSGINKRVHMTLVCPWYIKNTGMFSNAKLTLGAQPLDPKMLANRIISAVNCSEPLVVMPKILAYVLPMKTVLPIDLGWQLISKVTKSPKVMTDLYQRITIINNNNNNENKIIDPIVEQTDLLMTELSNVINNRKKIDPPAA